MELNILKIIGITIGSIATAITMLIALNTLGKIYVTIGKWIKGN